VVRLLDTGEDLRVYGQGLAQWRVMADGFGLQPIPRVKKDIVVRIAIEQVTTERIGTPIERSKMPENLNRDLHFTTSP